jgi:dipeptidase D
MEKTRLLEIFRELSNIPRCSGDEKKISDFIVSFADKLGLKNHQDDYNNVIVYKPSNDKLCKRKPIVLQSHLDMVCVKRPGTTHDFTVDPINIIEENGWLFGNGTTLGADNGIGASMMLNIMEDKSIKHPPLELCFTTDEERGLKGVSNIDLTGLKGDTLLNLDGEEEGTFFVSCAGGIRVMLSFTPSFRSVDSNGMKTIKISLVECNGGHSGLEIKKQFANPIQLLARILKQLDFENDVLLHSFIGGDKENSIPTGANAIISYPENKDIIITNIIDKLQETISLEYPNEPNIHIKYDDISEQLDALTNEQKNNFINLLLLIPNGALRFNLDTRDVSLSSNIGIIEFNKDEVKTTLLLRSNEDSTKAVLLENIKILAEKFEFDYLTRGDYPAWEYMTKSELRNKITQLYREKFGKEPKLESIHAGLECAYFAKKRPDWDMISMGCNIKNAHTTREQMEIESANRIYKFILEFLEKEC